MKIKSCSYYSIANFFIVILFLLSLQNAYSQENNERIDELINDANFEEAIQLCKEMLELHPDDPVLNFKIGYCYMNTTLKKSQATSYLQKSVDIFKQTNSQNSLELEAKFYLGKSLHKNYDFEKAIEIFQNLKAVVKNKEVLEAIDEEVLQCNNGIRLKQNPVSMQITNMGSVINSNYTDHSPVVSADESVLIFTSRRKQFDDEKAKPDGQYNEDIYISNFDGEKWSTPKSIGKNINTEANEASIGLSADGQQLLIYSDLDGGTILSSKLIGDEWSDAENLGSNINTRFRETHATISADNKYLYFTSDRPGGYGGLDIYQSEKQTDGSWGEAINLGPTINTEKDEEGPYIHPDGITLYFSSKGHETMGGFDIFSSKKNEFGTWSMPENIGYPVNTTEDDVFFNTTPDGKRAYFASYREDSYGYSDIYMMGLPEAEENPLTVVKGIVAACKSEIQNVKITVYDIEKQGIVGIYKPNSSTGKYLFILSPGKNYQAVFQVNGIDVRTEDFHISENSDYQVIYKLIKLESKTPCNDYVGINEVDTIKTSVNKAIVEDENTIIVENVLFKINNSEVSYFIDNLTKLANYLKENPNCIINIIGYADSQGQETYNLKLSTKRALMVYQFLVGKGVNKSQLNYNGAGEKNQLTINNYKDGSFIWQSLPYNRRVEFIVDSDPGNKLLIKQINVPKIYSVNQDQNTRNEFSEYQKKFTIQLGAFRKPISLNHFRNLKNIQMFYTGKLYHYTYGEFESEEQASVELKKVVEFGYVDAFMRRISYYFPDRQIEME